MVLVKNLKFCERFVLCKIHPEKVFGDVLVGKQTFIDNICKIDQEKLSGNVLPRKNFL